MAQASENVRSGTTIVAVAGAPAPLVTASRKVQSLVVVALDRNVTKVGIGGTADVPDAAKATQNCPLLLPGDSVRFGAVDMADISIDVLTNSDGVAWMVEE